MKKLVYLLCLLLMFSLTACDDEEPAGDSSSYEESQQETTLETYGLDYDSIYDIIDMGYLGTTERGLPVLFGFDLDVTTGAFLLGDGEGGLYMAFASDMGEDEDGYLVLVNGEDNTSLTFDCTISDDGEELTLIIGGEEIDLLLADWSEVDDTLYEMTDGQTATYQGNAGGGSLVGGGTYDDREDTEASTQPSQGNTGGGNLVGGGAYDDTEDTEEEAPVESVAVEIVDGPLLGFSAKDAYGNGVDNSIFSQYEVTMVNVWATWCGPCLNEMPALGELSQQLPEGTNLVSICIDGAYSTGTVQQIVEEAGLDCTVLVDGYDDYLYEVVPNLQSIPTTFFVNSYGEMLGQKVEGYPGGYSQSQLVSYYYDMIVDRMD